MKCVSCNYENQEGAKFCRGCGVKLELSTIITQTASLVKCIACGSDNIASAKFCAKCGKKMTGEASPIAVESSAARTPAAPTLATPSNPPASAILPQAPREREPVAVQKVAPNRKRIYAYVAIAIALIAIGGGGYFVIQQREAQRLALEEKQRALVAAEQARKQAEEQAAKLAQQKEEAEAKQRELEAQRREAALKQREAELERQAAEVKRREAEAARMNQTRTQQEADRREADERRQRAAAAVQPSRRTAMELCAARGNIISRGACQVLECLKPEHQQEALCRP